VIEAHSLSWSYGDRRVLDAVSLAAEHGRVLGLIGPNGSGKTTLLRLLYGALASPTGVVQVDGESLHALAPRESARRLAVVVQEAGGESSMTVAETVLLGRQPHLSTFQRTGPHDHAVAEDALRRVGATHLAARPFAALSGGERQRVLIARALTQQATHLLLDEPTNHLDIRYQHDVLGLVASLARESAHTAIVVLHDLNLAARYCDDVILLGPGGGGIVSTGPVEDVLRPEVLEPVYGIGVQRLDLDGTVHLLFHPVTQEVHA
jgi:iron complex transport system ATP-binding protein